MDKKQLIIILAVLLYFPVFIHAEIYHIKIPHKEKPGEFASPTNEFNFTLNDSPEGEFVTKGLFSRKSIFGEADSGEFRNPSGVANQIRNKFSSQGLIFKRYKDVFSSDRLISTSGEASSEKESLKSPYQGEFKPSLPKEKKQKK
ncbi:MAG: hypothetical protein PHR73_04815 [Candidatus Omnitrophica bacterium]|nr:hypothetical protein [Candidatus Omnitrophota bacterium]